jgi:ubiquinone/menaquinone biosynthesis C-methylase UbiE
MMRTKPLYRQMRPIVQPRLGEKVLDIGSGGVNEFISPRTIFYVSLDFSLEMLKGAQGKGMHLVCGDALALPFKSNVFTTVLYSSLLHHLFGTRARDTIQKVRSVLIQAYGCLQREGNTIVIESCLPRFFEMVEKLLFFFLKLAFSLTGQPEAFLFSVGTLKRLLFESGHSGIKNFEVFGKRNPWEWVAPFLGLPYFKVPRGTIPARWVVLEGKKE